MKLEQVEASKDPEMHAELCSVATLRAPHETIRRWCDFCGRAGDHYTSSHPMIPAEL